MKLCVLISEEFGVTVKQAISTRIIPWRSWKICHAGAEAQNLRKERGLSSYRFPEGYFCRVQQNPESTVYNIPFLFELDPAVDTRKLSDAIARMVSAHSYLLTQVYLDDNGEMVQRPGNETFVPEVIETTNEKFASQKESLVRPFKLEKDVSFVWQFM